MEIHRHFVTLDGRWGERQVHYRRAGAGPAVLLLHQSPQSSREMEPLMQHWGQHFTLLAPDTPGYGQSDPLGPAQPEITDLADAVVEFADAIGLRRFGIYGFHTGGCIGTEVAYRHAARVTAVAANGFVMHTAAEREHILSHYLPPVVPRWDGSHLAWLWGRIRQQAVFFPWHDHALANRMDFDMPSAAQLHAALVEMLRAGDNYATAYGAAFRYRSEDVVSQLRVPTLLTAAARDPLSPHLARIGAKSDAVTVQPAPGPDEALGSCLEHLLLHPGDAPPAAPATRAVGNRLWSQMLATAGGELRVQASLAGEGRPLLVVHDAGGSTATLRRIAAPLAGRMPVVTVDLPGHGDSAPAHGAASPTVRECADAVHAVLHGLGLGDAHLAGFGIGSLIAMDARQHGSHPGGGLFLVDVPWLDDADRQNWWDEGLPDTEPVWHGGHLLLQWHMLRDGRMFHPWFRRNRQGARRIECDLDETRLHLEFRELLKASGAWQNLTANALDYPVAAAISRAPTGTVIGSTRDSAWWLSSRRAFNSAGGLQFCTLPAAPDGWLEALLDAA